MQSAEYRSVEVIVVVNSRVVDAVEVVDSRRKDRGKKTRKQVETADSTSMMIIT